MTVRINGENRVESQVQEVGGFRPPPAFDPHQSKPTRRASDFSAGRLAPQANFRRILYIEDDRFIADMYRMKLEAEGWIIDVAYDGAEGLQRTLDEPPSLVLLDLLLPRMDGLEVLRRIRAEESTRDVPVLILSNALGLSGREQEARGLGIVDWIVKANTTPAQLSSRVAKILAD